MIFIPDAAPRFNAAWRSEPEAWIIAFFGRALLLAGPDISSALPRTGDMAAFHLLPPLRIGTLDGNSCYAYNFASPPELPAGFSLQDLRGAMEACPPELRMAISRGRELLSWRSVHKFCGACGARMVESDGDISMVCPECGTHFFPQIAPAVIVAVRRGEELLLAHNRNFRNNIYGLIAGFVETGESLEQAVERELMEESSIRVKNIRYFDSQTWPYPNSLMIGYTADYESGTAKADGVEIEKLGWFTRDRLPEIPLPGSIARRMIDAWLDEKK